MRIDTAETLHLAESSLLLILKFFKEISLFRYAISPFISGLKDMYFNLPASSQ